MTIPGIRSFLDERERELTIEIAKLTERLAPLEGELAYIRRAKAALGLSLSQMPLSSRGQGTMKHLVAEALRDQFPAGATTRQLLEFFDYGLGRKIQRQNLSPQLSRLVRAGIVERSGSIYLLRRPSA